jgi:hypothetical protein
MLAPALAAFSSGPVSSSSQQSTSTKNVSVKKTEDDASCVVSSLSAPESPVPRGSIDTTDPAVSNSLSDQASSKRIQELLDEKNYGEICPSQSGAALRKHAPAAPRKCLFNIKDIPTGQQGKYNKAATKIEAVVRGFIARQRTKLKLEAVAHVLNITIGI